VSIFVAVFQTELLYNLKHVAPYALTILFSANAVLWWGWGPAVVRGWAVNSDFYIVWLFGTFSFMTMPIFIALMMGDPVIRDFRIGVDPLIFSKPVGHGDYLFGKFFGNFFVLVCCQGFFALMPLLLQTVSTPGMIVLPPRVLPYFQHFLFFVVISSFPLAAIFFTVGTLTRNVRIVYGLAIFFYPLYIAWQLAMKGLPWRWRIALDPLLFNVGGESWHGRSAAWLNQLVVTYDADMIANRVSLIVASVVCLAVVYVRFSIEERGGKGVGQIQTSIVTVTVGTEKLYREPASADSEHSKESLENNARKSTALPEVKILTKGWRANLEQLIAALGVEFRLLFADRSLLVIAPIAIFACFLELAAYEIIPEASYSAAYASRTANGILLFLFGIAVFYVGETLHRDRELKVEPVLWSVPAPNFVLLLSKFLATLLLSACLISLTALTAVGIQIIRGHAPLQLQAYLMAYVVILVPGIAFMTSASVALNTLLREKYLAYAVALAIGGAVYYLTSQGYNNLLCNPVLYRLWTPVDLVNGGNHLARILLSRVYCLALTTLLLALAHLSFERKSTKGLRKEGRLSGVGWSLLVAVVSVAIAAITGFMIIGGT
jgi:hypothetical protein